MTNPKENDNGNGAELLAHDDDANPRREMLKRIGLSAGALAVTALGSSGASAQAQEAQANPPSDPESRIIERALKDNAYRKRLIANPRKVIGEEVGSAMPPRVEFKVVQETPTTVYLVLPYVPPVGAGKVSNTDLQNAAAGRPFTRSWFRPCPCRCSSLSVCAAQ